MLTAKTIEIIKAITPAVAANAETITTLFYERMFRGNPEVKAFFNQAHQLTGSQPKALAGAVAAYFAHIENIEVLSGAVETIAQKHCSLQIKPEHYPIVGEHLLAAIKDVFKEAATDDVIAAVAEAYQVLADICMNRERAIYETQAMQKGGWSGYRKFKIEKKIPESSTVTSFYLAPVDGGLLPSFKPGQYITVRIDHPTTPTSPRNYSLSDVPGEKYFRISVKREDGPSPNQGGLVSNYLHSVTETGSELDIGSPCGEFFFDRAKVGASPVIFIAGGIGITPLLSMAKSIAKEGLKNDAHFFVAALNSDSHAFGDEVRALQKKSQNIKTTILYDQPLDSDLATKRCDFEGRINRELLADQPHDKAHFFVCGPKSFMQSVISDLHALNVARERIHFEFFGPMQNF